MGAEANRHKRAVGWAALGWRDIPVGIAYVIGAFDTVFPQQTLFTAERAADPVPDAQQLLDSFRIGLLERPDARRQVIARPDIRAQPVDRLAAIGLEGLEERWVPTFSRMTRVPSRLSISLRTG